MASIKTSRTIDQTLNKSVNFEITIADIAKRSERRAWLIATIAMLLSLVLIGGYFYMLPLKEKVPYVIMADAYTGTSSVARLTRDFANRQITTSEAINKSNVAHYVMARESYDSFSTARQHEWTTTFIMSSPKVRDAYRLQVTSSNPDSPYKVYGDSRALRVDILSIVLRDSGPNQTPKGATVRFQRSVYDKQSGATQPLDNKIATLEFNYQPDLKMDDQYRIENPLGFQVTDYRVDNDYQSSAPVSTPTNQIIAEAHQTASTTQPASGATTASISSSSIGSLTVPVSSSQPAATNVPQNSPSFPQDVVPPSSRTPDNGAGHR